MNDQEIIYEITKAVFARLGPTADQGTVEGIVADVFRAVKPALSSDVSAREVVDSSGSKTRAIVSVFGFDRPGILSGVASVLADLDCSVVDINQTVVSGKFAMVMVVDVSRSTAGVAELKSRLRDEGGRLGVNIYAQREDLFNAMHRV
jgi:ACT domain-containing protein